MNILLLPAIADNDVRMLHDGPRAEVLDLAMRRASSTGSIRCALPWRAF